MDALWVTLSPALPPPVPHSQVRETRSRKLRSSLQMLQPCVLSKIYSLPLKDLKCLFLLAYPSLFVARPSLRFYITKAKILLPFSV